MGLSLGRIGAWGRKGSSGSTCEHSALRMYYRPGPADCRLTACKHCCSAGASCAQRVAWLALGTATLKLPVPAASRACPRGMRAVPGFAVFGEVGCSSGPTSGLPAPPQAAGRPLLQAQAGLALPLPGAGHECTAVGTPHRVFNCSLHIKAQLLTCALVFCGP